MALKYAVLALLLLALVAGCGSTGASTGETASTANAPAASEPDDPDLKRGKTCSGHPSATAMEAALLPYIKELIVLWPRVGKGSDGGCTSVARQTIVNHQGVIMTLSVVLYGDGKAPEPRDYRVFADEAMPRATFEIQPDPGRPILIELAGAASTSRDTLEQTLEFVPVEDLVAAVP